MDYRIVSQLIEHAVYRHGVEWGEGRIETPTTIDEIAVCFASVKSLEEFLESAVQDGGYEHFNSVARDTMRRRDIVGEEFDVRFEFLRVPLALYRIEAMTVLGGDAPLHQQANALFGEACVVHLSYKMANLQDYQDEVCGKAASRYKKIAEYSNSYGMFSYWRQDSQVRLGLPYLKPRVNLRDQ